MWVVEHDNRVEMNVVLAEFFSVFSSVFKWPAKCFYNLCYVARLAFLGYFYLAITQFLRYYL